MVKQILKAIGGAFSGAGEQAQANAKLSANAAPDNSAARAGMFNAMGGGINNAKDVSSAGDKADKQTASAAADAASNIDGLNGSDSGKSSAIGEAAGKFFDSEKGKEIIGKVGGALKSFSDERLKKIFENDDRVQYLAKINSYDFTYKPEAQKELGVDGNEHTGIIVQELEDNPAFKGCTDTDPESGFGVVNIPETTLANTAGLGDLARAIEDVSARLDKLEQIIGDR